MLPQNENRVVGAVCLASERGANPIGGKGHRHTRRFAKIADFGVRWERVRLLTRQFSLLCVAIFVTFAHQALLTPTIPLYVKSLGGSASEAGLALFAFALPSFVVRPIMGYAGDKWGGMIVLAAGAGAVAVGGLLYFIPFLWAVYLAAIVRGTAWGATSTGGLSVLVTITPHHRRGEASGYYNSAMACASILFPAVALWMIHDHGGFNAVFALSIFFAVAAVPMILSIGAEREERAPQSSQKTPSLSPAANRGLLLAMLLNLAGGLPQPSIVSFLPLYAQSLNLGDVSIFYVASGLLTVFLRPVLGRRGDTMGRGVFIAFGLAIQAVGYSMVFLGSTMPVILTGAVIAACGPAFVGAAAMALAMDFAPDGGRGRAMATFSMSYQMGGGLGSLLAGGLADMFGLRSMYAGALVITALGAALLASAWRALPRPGDGMETVN